MSPNIWREVVRQNGRLPVTSTSMRPALEPGDLVEVEPLAHPLRVGDVGVYAHGNRLIVHRYLGAGLFQGDNRQKHDPAVPDSCVVGRVRYRVRGGRKAQIHTVFHRLACMQRRVRAMYRQRRQSCREWNHG